jgi:hypothetical protein
MVEEEPWWRRKALFSPAACSSIGVAPVRHLSALDAVEGSDHWHRNVPYRGASEAAAKPRFDPHIRETECLLLASSDGTGPDLRFPLCPQ